MKRLALLILLSFQFHLSLSRDNYPRDFNVDALHYRISLLIDDSTNSINAQTEIVFLIKGSVRSMTLDFAGLNVISATENGRAVNFSRIEDRLTISLHKEYRSGDTCTLTIDYQGEPSDGLIFQENKFGNRTIFADNWPNRAHHWFPSIDHPYDKATVEFFVTASSPFDVVANGALVETRALQNGLKLTHWSQSVPIPTYCMVIGVAEFSIVPQGEWNQTPLTYYLYPRDRENGVKDFGRALEMIEYYSTLIGSFPYEKLALVQSTTRYGGMENASAIFFTERAFDGSGRLEGTVAHEIAHQWFGDAVTAADWHHLWLSEGFATYFGALFYEQLYGRDTLVSILRQSAQRIHRSSEGKNRPIYDTTITNLMGLLNTNNYQKGAWVLHMLRGIMGDNRFFAGIRDYYATFRNGNARTGDFQKIMERHAGRDLDWFFREWIEHLGFPVYRVFWRWDQERNNVVLTIEQMQQGTIFQMPLTVETSTGGRPERTALTVEKKEQTFTLKTLSRPETLKIDPDEWVLKVVTVEGQ